MAPASRTRCRRKEVIVHRTFEEVGGGIDGVDYGHFTGEVQFDPDGSVALVDIERSDFQGPPLRLDLDTLLIERTRLRNKYGISFMTDYPGDDVRSHRRRFELYRALAETLEAKFTDDVTEYFRQARQDAKGSHAA
jgi:hypothetical protein